MYTPVNPSITILKWGVRGSALHGLVFVMRRKKQFCKTMSGVRLIEACLNTLWQHYINGFRRKQAGPEVCSTKEVLVLDSGLYNNCYSNGYQQVAHVMSSWYQLNSECISSH